MCDRQQEGEKKFHVNEPVEVWIRTPASGTQGWTQELLGRLDPSFVLLTMHVAQSQSWRALSRLAHHLCHAVMPNKDVQVRLQLVKKWEKKRNIKQHQSG
jgi:hypothetical protein